ncbi:BA75_01511T0 [Komagataella pastoris]|uniref:BA75_01511T0 n=1 Tax=Komagataella pastoris TaxID=4922 RepID=A0A1B2J7F8_PICPA|nr:BA75_01511T0 [Komagataella pastoris]
MEEVCSICLEVLVDKEAFTEPCLHYYHNECIKEWTKRANTCPKCRRGYSQIRIGEEVISVENRSLELHLVDETLEETRERLISYMNLCALCEDPSTSLIYCESCGGSFHFSCIGIGDELDSEWCCPLCGMFQNHLGEVINRNSISSTPVGQGRRRVTSTINTRRTNSIYLSHSNRPAQRAHLMTDSDYTLIVDQHREKLLQPQLQENNTQSSGEEESWKLLDEALKSGKQNSQGSECSTENKIVPFKNTHELGRKLKKPRRSSGIKKNAVERPNAHQSTQLMRPSNSLISDLLLETRGNNKHARLTKSTQKLTVEALQSHDPTIKQNSRTTEILSLDQKIVIQKLFIKPRLRNLYDSNTLSKDNYIEINKIICRQLYDKFLQDQLALAYLKEVLEIKERLHGHDLKQFLSQFTHWSELNDFTDDKWQKIETEGSCNHKQTQILSMFDSIIDTMLQNELHKLST